MEKSSFIWSPDGKQILFRWSNNPDSIYVFNVASSTYKKLTNGEKFIANPRWQPVPCN
jgi:Tol biopolymer transport system component